MAAPVADPAVLARHVALLAVDLDDPEFRQHAAAHARAVRAELSALVAEAAAVGELAAVDPEELARALWLTYNGALLAWAVEPSGPLVERLRADLERALAPHRRT